MSLNHILDQGIPPQSWTNLNIASMKTNSVTSDSANIQDITTHNIIFGGYDGEPINFQIVDGIHDLPTPIGNVITMETRSYMITSIIDLQGLRLVFPEGCSLSGTSLETSGFKSTGLPAGQSLITCYHTLPIHNIRLESSEPATYVFDLDATGNPNQALDWYYINVYDSPNVGTIKNFGNFVAFTMGFLNSSNLIFDGTWGTISIATTIFTPQAGGTCIIIPDTAIITRRFRIIYSAFVPFPGTTGIHFSTLATVPNGAYILDSVSFTAGGTYITGVMGSDNKANFKNNNGISNSAEIGEYYLTSSAATTIPNTTLYYPLSGTTTGGSFTQRFTTTNNSLVYIGSITKPFIIRGSCSLTSANNNVVEIGISYNGNIVTPSIQSTTTNASGRSENIAFFTILELFQNDEVRVVVRNTTGANNITASALHVIVNEI